MFVESGHTAAAMEKDRIAAGNGQDEEKVFMEEEDGDFVGKLQDWHTMLSVIMEKSGLKDLLMNGMVFDYVYKRKLYRNLELLFYIHFVKCDGEEGDKLCAKYLSRAPNVAQICRYCLCPTKWTSHICYKVKYKT